MGERTFPRPMHLPSIPHEPARLDDQVQSKLEMTMKTILSALVALSFLAGAVAPAAAYEGSLIERLDKEGRGGHAT